MDLDQMITLEALNLSSGPTLASTWHGVAGTMITEDSSTGQPICLLQRASPSNARRLITNYLVHVRLERHKS